MLRPDLNYKQLYMIFDSRKLPVLIELIRESILGHDGIVPLAELAGSNGHSDFDLEVAEKFDTLPDDLRAEIGAAAELIARYQMVGAAAELMVKYGLEDG